MFVFYSVFFFELFCLYSLIPPQYITNEMIKATIFNAVGVGGLAGRGRLVFLGGGSGGSVGNLLGIFPDTPPPGLLGVLTGGFKHASITAIYLSLHLYVYFSAEFVRDTYRV